jgi:succinate dehydrogenase/fumarate reductase cytochrome b subunit
MRDQRLWTWHLIAGVTILVFLGLHMGVMHLNTMLGLFSAVPDKAPIDWGNVIARSQSAFFAVTYVVLLGAALFHGLYGLRNILFELGPGTGLRKAISAVLLLLGVCLFGYGAWAAWAVRTIPAFSARYL